LREINRLEDPGVDEKDNMQMDLQEVRSTGLIWLRVGTGGGLL